MSQQTRAVSLIESVTNTVIGWVISLAAWMWIVAPAFSLDVTVAEAFTINLFFTMISIVRGYALRRAFIHYHEWLMEKLA